MRNLFLLSLCAAACTDSGETTDTTPDPTGPSEQCIAVVASVTPEDGAREVFYRSSVEVVLAEADASATIELRDRDGVTATGASASEDGITHVWSGDPLLPNETYDVLVRLACGTVTSQFTTSHTGGTAVDVTGKVYAIDLASGHWRAPEGFEDVLEGLAGAYGLRVSPTAVSASELSMLAAVTLDGVQNTCAPTFPLTDASYTNPYFELSVPEFDIPVGTEPLAVTDFGVSGTFAPNGSAIEGVAVRGLMDTRPLAEVVLGTPDGCPALAAFGVTCEACPDGSGDFCVAVDVVDLVAEEVELALVEILEPAPGCGGT
jgi:hypothetical protein